MSGKEVAAARARLGLTQAEMAERLGVHRVTVAHWERGALAVPAMAALAMASLRGSLRRDAPRQRGRNPRPNRRK